MRLVRLLLYLLAVLAALYLLAAVLYAIPVVSGVLDDTMEVKFDRADPSIVADYRNGLTPAQKESYYHLSQGAEILLTAVDVTDADSTKPFVENLERFGLLPDPARTDGLPVGLTVSSNPFTCTNSSGSPTTSIRRAGLRRSSARSSPISRRRVKAYSAAGMPDATSMAMIDGPRPASSGCADCVRRPSERTRPRRSGSPVRSPTPARS